MKREYLRYGLGLILIISVLSFFVSCGSGGGGGGSSAGKVGEVTLSIGSASIVADGASWTTITATVKDRDNEDAKDGTQVTFSTTAGTIAGSAAGADTSFSTKTNDGIATAVLTSPTKVGTATVTITAGGVSATGTITFSPGGVGVIYVMASPNNLTADGTSQSEISVTVTDANGNAVADNEMVSFAISSGTGTLSALTATTSGGFASVTYTASQTAGNVRITVQATNGTSTFVDITLITAFIGSVEVTAGFDAIPADGSTSTLIMASVKDTNGDNIADGTTVSFATTAGSLSSTTATTTNGVATVNLTSSTHVGTATVMGTAGGISDTATVQFVSGAIGSVEVTATPDNLTADGTSQSTINIIVRDFQGNPADGKIIIVTVSSGTGTLSALSVTTSGGMASVTYTASVTAGTETVRATAVNGVWGSVNITLTGSGVTDPALLSLGLSQTSVKSDNSDTTTVTATVLDENNAGIENVVVGFSASGGMINQGTVVTDENGEAQVTFRSGTIDQSNHVVTITATVVGLTPRTIPIQITGTTVTLVTDATNLEVGGGATANLTVTVANAGGVPIYDSEVTLSVDAGATGTVNIVPATGNTDVNGELAVVVTGTSAGDVTVRADSMGATAIQAYTIGVAGAVFEIDRLESPVGTPVTFADPYSLSTNTDLNVIVTAPGLLNVDFAATMGEWDGGGQLFLQKPVVVGPPDEASAIFSSTEAGLVNIQVSDTDDPGTIDTMTVAVSAPSSEASQLALQATSYVVAPSLGGTTNSVTLTATVKNVNDQVVGGAPVIFSLANTTGGGEYLDPVIVYTDDFGLAIATFYSGSLSSGAEGVDITATVVGLPVVTDTKVIVIGGTAGSVVIGRSTEIESIDNDTAYRLPMAVLVSDSNGNPMSGQNVTLNLWPARYAPGYWVLDLVTGACFPDDGFGTPPVYVINEDGNRNLICDGCVPCGAGEDVNADCELTPQISAAGSVPASVVTDQDGVANFYLVFLKAYAAWIEVDVTASTLVLGTETQSTLTFVLPWAKTDAAQCILPDSPYN